MGHLCAFYGLFMLQQCCTKTGEWGVNELACVAWMILSSSNGSGSVQESHEYFSHVVDRGRETGDDSFLHACSYGYSISMTRSLKPFCQ